MINRMVAAFGAALLAAFTIMPAQAAVEFNFTFTAPLTNGDTATGSGVLTTEDADAGGRYWFVSATGSFMPWADADPRAIAGVTGLDVDNWDDLFPAGYLFADAGGIFRTEGITFFDEMPFFGIGLGARLGNSYGGFFSEVTVRGGTITFTPLAATPGVPEPATWALMLLGFGAVGHSLRRRPAARLAAA